MTTTEQPWTIGRLLDWTIQFLAQKGAEFPRLDAQMLLSHALSCKRIELYTRYEEVASEEARAKFRELVRRRIEGCPVAYLVGRKEFFSLEFEVSPAVLIPRPDTECVVTECLQLAKGIAEPHVLDIGTGSGCLAVTIAVRHKGAKVTATDVSPAALAMAARNAEKHGVKDRIRFLEGNVFEPVPAGEKLDFILSNPPYIPHGALPTLEPGVRDYEPHLALDGGEEGFAVFDRLVAGAPAYLKPGGYLLVEIGMPQEGPAHERLLAHGGYELGKTVVDGSGHPRVLRAKWRGAEQVNRTLLV